MLFRPALRQFEGEFQHPVNAGAAHHRFLNDNFALGPLEHAPADRRIFALGILADDIEIDIPRHAFGKRRGHPGKKPDRPQIDILVEFPPEFQQRAPERDMVRNFLRPADSAEEQRVMAADPGFPVFRHHVAMLGVIVAAGKIEMIEMEWDIEAAGGGFQRAYSFGHHFLADAVARNHRDIISVLCHFHDPLEWYLSVRRSIGHGMGFVRRVYAGYHLVGQGQVGRGDRRFKLRQRSRSENH